jgi:hypothetical protein
MALNTRQRLQTDIDLKDNYTVIKNEVGLRAPGAATADVSFFTASPSGSIRIPSGYFWQRLAGGKCRVLPIVKLTAATATNSPLVSVHCASIFKVGEILQRQSDNVVLGTIASINAETNVITLAANAAAVMAAGVFLHVAGTTIAKPTTPTGAGVLGFNASILDLADFDDVAYHVGATVWTVRMPQPAAVMALFPLIVLD